MSQHSGEAAGSSVSRFASEVLIDPDAPAWVERDGWFVLRSDALARDEESSWARRSLESLLRWFEKEEE